MFSSIDLKNYWDWPRRSRGRGPIDSPRDSLTPVKITTDNDDELHGEQDEI